MTKSKICDGGQIMESVRYWQDFGEAMDRMFVDGASERCSALPPRHIEKKQACEAIMYRGRVMTMDVYLAVPTFMRRGITIVA
ncbi:MAG: hypothetical protein KAS94_08865 [Desulfobulbaceae bacterium]|nr:hypothetical protein [Desulfobulbaceae bacterium]